MGTKERIRAEVDAIHEQCQGESREKKLEILNACLSGLISDGWHYVDVNEVEDKIRFRMGFPPALRD